MARILLIDDDDRAARAAKMLTVQQSIGVAA
jgi:hypothetical protein